MASIEQKNGVYHVRFRFRGRQFKKSLKTTCKGDGKAALHIVETTVHRLLTGQLSLPPSVEPGDFIVSGGTLTEAPTAVAAPPPPPSLRALVESYLTSQQNKLAETYLDSQRTHLSHLARHLGGRADAPVDRIGFHDLDRFLEARLKIRDVNTVIRERVTLLQFFKWVVKQKHLASSPAAELEPLKGGGDLPTFQTLTEVEQTLARGGLSARDEDELWDCVYLDPSEIAKLLKTVRQNAAHEDSYFLHAIPAYTGMRRGEVLRLKWMEVDFKQGFVTARSRKQSRSSRETARRINMHPELRGDLLAWREKRPKGQFVLSDRHTLEPLAKDRANRDFWQPMRDSEWCLDGKKNWFKVGFHTYRHSFASNLAAAGVDQRYIDRWMGHQTEAMRKRYQHLFPERLREAIECFSLLPVAVEGK